MLATMRSKAAQNPMSKILDKEEDIQTEREKIRSHLYDTMNPNVDIPLPNVIELAKVAIILPQFDHCRKGVEVKNLKEPAPPIETDCFDPSLAYIPLIKRKRNPNKKKRGENEIKLFDFVDSSKAI